MDIESQLQQTIDDMVDDHRGILAADESLPTMEKRFKPIGVESTEETRRAWRSLLVTTPGLGEYISGIIFFEETLYQSTDDGTPIPEAAWKQKIVPGVKVDKGKEPLPGAPGDLVTRGLDGLGERITEYMKQGARFAKWREVYPIARHNPTLLGRKANAEVLARYAATCQELGIVPIVEPEVLMDGDHEIDRCAEVTEQAPPEEVAEATLRVLKRAVPAAVPSINFLSGGQGPEEATANLDAINRLRGNAPWQLSISYGRALQQPALHAWLGKAENREKAQQELLKRARLNSLARKGEYDPSME